MTLPVERARALRWAGELLREIECNPKLDAELRRHATVVLRHYPREFEILGQAQIQLHFARVNQLVSGPWLEPEAEVDE